MKSSQKNKKNNQIDIGEIYTPLSVAKKEIERRWNDKELRKKVEDFLGGDMPKFLKNSPRAVLVRYVVSPDIEFSHFLDLAKEIKLKPICYEYSRDKFVASNSDKYHLCKLFFHDGNGKKWGDKINTMRIVDFNKTEGKMLNKIKTLWGDNFVDFHHRILFDSYPKMKTSITDFSNWFNKQKKKSKQYYYIYYLSIFICHGILFENFLTNEEENEFTYKKVLPSLKKLQKIFGIKPLIVPLAPIEDENYLYWWCYPESVKKNLNINK